MTGDPIAGHPLVTFALFAFEQEQFVRDAIEGALAQSYEPLEIILSDDGSSDRTFAIMQEMAAAYRGPHSVKLRRSEINLGTSLHVAAVAAMAEGELLVVAAGDDISLPHRTTDLAEAWLRHGQPTALVHSRLSQFTTDPADGKDIPLRYDAGRPIDIRWFLRHRELPFMAPTAAYSIDIFRDFPPLLGGSIIEDGPLAARVLLAGQLIAVDRCLVHQRVLERSAGRGHSILDPVRWNRLIMSRMATCVSAIRDIERLERPTAEQLRLQRHYARTARRLSPFMVSGRQGVGLAYRIGFVARYSLFYPTSASFAVRLYNAVSIAGWSFLRQWRGRR
jgi:glycosyltransferase involved in cell wall biosynthesis